MKASSILCLRRFGWAALCLLISRGIQGGGTVPAKPDQPSVIILAGAPGITEYEETFAGWAETWRLSCEEAGARHFVLGTSEPVENQPADLDQFKRILQDEPRESSAELWLVLIGHGTYDGKSAKFNLRGPDFSAEDLRDWLQPFQRPVVIINSFSSSGPFLNSLSGPGRVVVTATKSGYEQNYSRFAGHFAQAIGRLEADLDKDEQISVLEAFIYASKGVQEFYETEGRLATEHALLDDNGDGMGTPSDWFRGVRAVKQSESGAAVDGLRAHQVHLIRSPLERQLSPEVRKQRDQIELAIAALRATKASMPEDEYYRKLEPLMVEIARLYEAASASRAKESLEPRAGENAADPVRN